MFVCKITTYVSMFLYYRPRAWDGNYFRFIMCNILLIFSSLTIIWQAFCNVQQQLIITSPQCKIVLGYNAYIG